MVKDAFISPCRTYRYWLLRQWNAENGKVNFIMLNPSTADAEQDDPTIRRCMRFASDWGYGGILVTNLFAFRSSSPKELKIQVYPEGGAENQECLLKGARESSLVVAAWGAHGAWRNRARHVTSELAGVGIKCLGLTKDGHPQHPLYIPADRPLIPFPNPWSPSHDRESSRKPKSL